MKFALNYGNHLLAESQNTSTSIRISDTTFRTFDSQKWDETPSQKHIHCEETWIYATLKLQSNNTGLEGFQQLSDAIRVSIRSNLIIQCT